MDKHIYKKFTIENNIFLSKEALGLLKDSIKSTEDLDDIILKYKNKSQSEVLDLQILKDIIKGYYQQEKGNNFYMKNWQYAKATRVERYNFLKDKLKEPVELVQELQDNKETKIFGVLYKNKKNVFVLEDESGVIEVQFGAIDCFVFDFSFLLLQGNKAGDVFIVNNVSHVPLIKGKPSKIQESGELSRDILFFYGQFNAEIEMNNKEIILVHPESKSIRDLALSRGFKVIDKDNYSLNNPHYIFINDKIFILYVNEILKHRENGLFLGKGYVKSFLRTYLSQYDLNLFESPHVYLSFIPDALILFQNSYSLIENLSGVHYASVSPFKDTSIYLEYLTEADLFVLRSKKV